MLGRVLQAAAAAMPEIGYCQGMNFVAGTLLLGCLPASITGGIFTVKGDKILDLYDVDDEDGDDDDESEDDEDEGAKKRGGGKEVLSDEERLNVECDVFTIMQGIVSKDGKLAMSGLWQAGVPRMKLRVFQLDRLMRWTLPRLHAHFLSIQLAPEILVVQWFLTLFSYTVPMGLTLRIWDYIFLGGWPAMFRIAISLMAALEGQLLNSDLEGVGLMMRDWKKVGGETMLLVSHNDVMKRAHATAIGDDVLQQLQEHYALEIISMSEVSLQASQANDAAAAASAAAAAGSGDFITAAVNSIGGVGSSDLGGILGSNSNASSGIMSSNKRGPDATFWLQRYGEGVSDATAIDMLRIRDEVRDMEAQVCFYFIFLQIK